MSIPRALIVPIAAVMVMRRASVMLVCANSVIMQWRDAVTFQLMAQPGLDGGDPLNRDRERQQRNHDQAKQAF